LPVIRSGDDGGRWRPARTVAAGDTVTARRGLLVSWFARPVGGGGRGSYVCEMVALEAKSLCSAHESPERRSFDWFWPAQEVAHRLTPYVPDDPLCRYYRQDFA